MFLGSTATVHYSFISNSGELLDVLDYQINVGMNFALNLKMFRARGTVTTKAPLRVQFSPALGGGGGKGLKPKLLLGFTK